MAINGRFRVSMGDVFPAGAFVAGVKIGAPVRPVPPEVVGLLFRPVEFDGLTVTPYVDGKRHRVAYSLWARAMRARTPGAKASGRPAGADGKAA